MNQIKPLSFLDATKENIWQFPQNNPNFVIADIKSVYPDIDESVIERSLMARGVNKWLKVRRDLIAHKKKIKNRIKQIQVEILEQKKICSENFVSFADVKADIGKLEQLGQFFKAKEKLTALQTEIKVIIKERTILKNLCMTERWQDWKGKSVEDMNTFRESD
jgi:hypothetical protein